MHLTTSTIKSVASRNVWSSDWTAPFCDAILFYKKERYNHTHPEWKFHCQKILKELDISVKHKGYNTPFKITLIRFTQNGFHQALARKAIYISIGDNLSLGAYKKLPDYLYGELDKVYATPSWTNDFWHDKKIWNQDLVDTEYAVVGNMGCSLVYPQEGNMFIEVLYK